ncbi:unnamed protein product [Notodromas monacha]|uniref:BTB domain-containing protein n=1 Tax=Notodromas monacha TaxID=399045 RepID=A0A7R9GCJ0_9CRUS|nr:unnamed protein product [Notodromas monacha]CAG0916033.1 unnamed protein product [Notodromas monacha]
MATNAWRLQGFSTDALELLNGAEFMRPVVRRNSDVVNEVNNFGEGILNVACNLKLWDCVKFLAENGAPVNLLGDFDYTALHILSEVGNAELIEVLVTRGADIEARARRWFERTPLHLAAQALNFDAVKSLLNLGARVDSIDEHGCTALHLATAMSSVSNGMFTPNHMIKTGMKAAPVVSILLSFGADTKLEANVHFTTDEQEIPLETAQRRNCLPVAEILELWDHLKHKAQDETASLGFKRFLKSQQLSDVTFLIRDEESRKKVEHKIPAHKILLASESPVFEAMFRHPFKEKKSNTVRYCELDLKTFEQLLNYVYKKTIEDSPDSLTRLLEVADRLQIPKLKWDCEVLLLRYLDTQDAEDAYTIGTRHNAALVARVAEILLSQSPPNGGETPKTPGSCEILRSQPAHDPVTPNVMEVSDVRREPIDDNVDGSGPNPSPNNDFIDDF